MDSLTRSRVVTFILICTVPFCAARQGLTTSSGEGADGLTRKTHVIITDNLGEGLQLTVHCKSGDDDLGPHFLVDGQQYEIVFKPNFFETTLYYCSFSWVGGWVDGVVYKARRDISRCGMFCLWTVTKEGVNGKNSDGVIDIVYKWN